ncbi:MAG TPA: hypothetical protein ENK49_08800 [Gammaproteobacteria bacterium]|nr:hypothetical protein [Gammaproteobacteria bacterium]
MVPTYFRHTGQRLQMAALAAITLFLSAGCATDQVHSSVQFDAISLAADDLETWGLGFITPSTVTGQEQDVQNLAFVFARVLEKERPDIHVVSLPEALSSVNRAGLADEYKQMYVDYSDTGIFKKDALHRVGEVIGARYLAQLKLSSFNQNSRGRFSFLGLRLMQTKAANIRLFLQIWDSDSGAIVWEGAEEMNYAWDTSSEKPVTFQLIVEEIARNLVNKLPGAPDNPAQDK